MTARFEWQTVRKDQLSDFLFGLGTQERPSNWIPGPETTPIGHVAIGWAEDADVKNSAPSLIVLGNDAAEVFSWLNVYAPEVAPLSQFARVVTQDDWRRFQIGAPPQPRVLREDAWSSIVLGELIAQADGDAEIRDIPMSRGVACFSSTIARATCLYRSEFSLLHCTDRLRFIETDKRFSRRQLSVSNLLPIWDLALSLLRKPRPEEAVELVLNHIGSNDDRILRNPLIDVPLGMRALSSDSIEERVRAFQRLTEEALHTQGADGLHSEQLGAVLACAAFLVGRSTSHEFLVRRVRRSFPTAPVWFGFLAAIAGPASWHQEWARAAKSLERQLRARFDWHDSIGFDLGWSEFYWLAGVTAKVEGFALIPKLLPRVLSVEVIPGAVFQFRLAGGSSETDSRLAYEATHREQELNSLLSQFVALAAKVRPLLDSAPIQHSLALDDGGVSPPKTARSKKGKSQI